MSPDRASRTRASSSNKPKKKLPACDYCKARRVLCHPQPDGRSCPRCLEKGVKSVFFSKNLPDSEICRCTTTPVVRRKRKPEHGGGTPGAAEEANDETMNDAAMELVIALEDAQSQEPSNSTRSSR
jgi:hypothetical protein